MKIPNRLDTITIESKIRSMNAAKYVDLETSWCKIEVLAKSGLVSINDFDSEDIFLTIPMMLTEGKVSILHPLTIKISNIARMSNEMLIIEDAIRESKVVTIDQMIDIMMIVMRKVDFSNYEMGVPIDDQLKKVSNDENKQNKYYDIAKCDAVYTAYKNIISRYVLDSVYGLDLEEVIKDLNDGVEVSTDFIDDGNMFRSYRTSAVELINLSGLDTLKHAKEYSSFDNIPKEYENLIENMNSFITAYDTFCIKN